MESTQPEPVNINELKRLLHECFDEVYRTVEGGTWAEVARSRERVMNKIKEAILNGDDS